MSHQNPELQQEALTEAGCEGVSTDTASGALAERDQLTATLAIILPDGAEAGREGPGSRGRQDPREQPGL
jgi:hypothetical protein